MTVEERVEWCLDQKGGRPLFGDEARTIIAQALHDQIEDCAEIAEFHHDCGHEGCFTGQPGREIAEQIRDLAEPIEERKETER